MASSVTPDSHQLELLGGAWITTRNQRLQLVRKAAGCLAYLAFEGEQSRSTLAGLLWPDMLEAQARTNLRQCLRRLKALANVVQGDERLSLINLEVDTINLENRALMGDFAPLTMMRGELLDGYSFDDCPEFEDWLYRQRQRWWSLRRTAFREQIRHAPRLDDRLELARHWLGLEPLSEQALQTLVSLLVEAKRTAEARSEIETFQLNHQREFNEPAPHVLNWLEQPPSALTPPTLLEQARAAQNELRHVEAVSLYLEAADAFSARGDLNAECDALLNASGLMNKFDQTARLDALLERIAGLARTPQQVLRWREELMNRAYHRARWETCLREAERVLRLATRLEDQETALNAQGFIAATHMELGDVDRSAQGFEAVLTMTRAIGDPNLIHAALNNLAYARDGQGRRDECLALVTEALEIAESIGDVPQQLSYLNQMTFYAKTMLGRTEARSFARRGLALHRHIGGRDEDRLTNLGFLCEIERDAGLYKDALEAIVQAVSIASERNLSCAFLHRMRASVYLQLGAFQEVATELECGLARPDATTTDLMSLTAVQMRLKRWQGTGTLEEVEDTIAAWQVSNDHGFLRRFQNERSYYMHGLDRVQAAQEALGNASGFAEFFLALAWLEAGQPDQALLITSALVQRLERFDPNDLYTPEILLTHARVLTALDHPNAPGAWQNARDWVLDKARFQVPQAFQHGFLEQNPINRAILETVNADERLIMLELRKAAR
jgi:DNA-binding SARP family transcriptional activator